ncbi:MAG TPA: c-type cytochrome biogenesis protein CcmI [Patescibacteria group bacterium]|nr:c-type cytochrome biogenesis protein CcmI [Patescibacteria group bacterium]
MFILAAALIVAGVALFVAAPLGIGLTGARARSADELKVERHEHERALAVQALRELEFDREMGKLSDADYESMHKALEERALTAMAAIENIRTQSEKPKKTSVTPLTPGPRKPTLTPRRTETVPTLVLHTEPPRPSQPAHTHATPSTSSSRKPAFCPQCGMRVAADSNFCAQCGIAIRPVGAAARSE